MVGYFLGIFMNFRKIIKDIRLKIFKYLVLKYFKPEIKENIMRKYYVSYIVINPTLPIPAYADIFIDIDGKLTEKSINDIKKKITDTYNKKNNFQMNASGVRVVIQEIFDCTKEENEAILNEAEKRNLEEQKIAEENYYIPGTVEIINGKKYIGGKLVEDDENERQEQPESN